MGGLNCKKVVKIIWLDLYISIGCEDVGSGYMNAETD
jgi:hypothetical protein